MARTSALALRLLVCGFAVLAALPAQATDTTLRLPYADLKAVDNGDGTATPYVTPTATPAGTAVIGKVGIDQTTPGTTNAVAPIAGQNGVAGGSGVVGATTQRTVLATDVALPAGENHVGSIGALNVLATGNFTRPADTTAYASGDLVANSTTAGSVAPITLAVGRGSSGASITGMLRRVVLMKSGTSTTNASFRVHLYNATSITFANGDNGAWSTNKSANYIGSFDVTMDRAFTDGALGLGAPNNGSEINFTTQNIYGVIEARAAYTPGNAEVFTLSVEAIQN